MTTITSITAIFSCASVPQDFLKSGHNFNGFHTTYTSETYASLLSRDEKTSRISLLPSLPGDLLSVCFRSSFDDPGRIVH